MTCRMILQPTATSCLMPKAPEGGGCACVKEQTSAQAREPETSQV